MVLVKYAQAALNCHLKQQQIDVIGKPCSSQAALNCRLKQQQVDVIGKPCSSCSKLSFKTEAG